MRTRSSRSRPTAWWLIGGLGGLLIVSAAGAHAFNNEPLKACPPPPEGRVLSYRTARFCLQDNPDIVWLQQDGGDLFLKMATLCCDEPPRAVTHWSRLGFHDTQHPRAHEWYPLEVRLLKEPIQQRIATARAAIESSRGASTPGQIIEGSPSEEAVPLEEATPEETVPPEEAVPSEEATPEDAAPRLPIDWKNLAIIALSVAVVVLFALLALFRLRKPTGLSKGSRFSQAELQALTAALSDGLRQVLKQTIVVDVVPPSASRISEWEPLLKRLAEVLGTPPPLPNTKASAEGRGLEPAAHGAASGPSKSVVTKVVPQQHSSGRRYVQRDIVYGVGSKNFGGEAGFLETPSDWAGFYVEPTGKDTGLLYPNASAREYDALYEELFGFGHSDFPFKGTVRPKPVRWDGQLWIIDSRA